MPEPIDARNVILLPVSQAVAAALAGGDFTGVTAGDGWPHADTVDALRLVAAGCGRGWLVVLDGLVIGDCGTHGPAGPAGEVEIGYGLAAPYRGRGYGGQVVSALARSLRSEADITSVVAHTDAGYTPSRRALERAGFQLTGEQGGQCRYVLRAPQPSPASGD